MAKIKDFLAQVIMVGLSLILTTVVCVGVYATFYWAVTLKVDHAVSLVGRCQCYHAPGCAVRSHEFAKLQREYPACLKEKG